MTGLPSYNVVIAGGAVMGSALAYFLASDPGFKGRVCVVERDPSYRDCATTRSVASIRHPFSTPENIRLSMAGTAFVREAEERLAVDGQGPGLSWRERGYLFLAGERGWPTLEESHRVQRAEGADVALLAPAELQARFPWLAVGDLAGGSLGLSGEGWLDAHALLHGFKRKAQSLGVEYRQDEVVALERQGRRVQSLRLADGSRLRCDWVANCAGTGAAALAASAGIDLPVRARRRCVFHFSSPEAAPGAGLVIDPSGVYFRPEGRGFIGGVAPPDDADPDVADRLDFAVDHALWDEVVWPTLAQRVPGFEAARLLSSWAGHYDVNLLDHNLIVGPHPELDNLLFANGFSGHGLQQAPAVGRALAEWVLHGRWCSLDLSALGWERVLAGRALREQAVV